MKHTLIAALLLLPLPAAGQSFDCGKARTRVEKLICADRALRELDEHLGRYYAAGRLELEAASACLQSDQAQWLKSTRDTCADAACLKSAYLNRLAELDPLQPGATAIKNIALPAAPALVWVIPPALDTTAAPSNPKAKPFETTGTVLDEVAGGDGFILQTGDGTKLPLVLLMFLEGKTQEVLTALAKEEGVTIRARGYAASDGTRMYFEPSRCTFIHRLPAADTPPDRDQEPQELERAMLWWDERPHSRGNGRALAPGRADRDGGLCGQAGGAPAALGPPAAAAAR